MTSGAPWSVKGIDPKAREIAKDLARRSGMTLGEWLNSMIAAGEPIGQPDPEPAFEAPPDPIVVGSPRLGGGSRYEVAGHPADEVGRVAEAIERLTARIEAAEQRSTLAITGIDQSVRGALSRLESAEREQVAVAARFEGAVEELNSNYGGVGERLRRLELESTGPRSAEALRAIEGMLGKVAGQVYEGESRTRETLAAVEARLAKVESAETPGVDPAQLAEVVVARVEEAEGRTTDALRDLGASFVALDRRLRTVESGAGDGGARLESLAADLTRRMEATRAEMASNLQTASASRFDRMERKLSEMAAHIQTAETRSAQAIERMGREVVSMADSLSRRVQTVENHGADAIEQIGGEVARIATVVEQKLNRADGVQAQALEKLGGEIARITERLAERIANSERRGALAIDEVGEQVARVTERINQRQERSSADLAERIRQSEERTARLLDEAREKIDQSLNASHRRLAEQVAQGPVMAPVAPVARRAETPREPFGDPFASEPFPSPGRTIPEEAFAPQALTRPTTGATPPLVEPEPFPVAERGPPAFSEEDFEAADGCAPISEDVEIPYAPVETPASLYAESVRRIEARDLTGMPGLKRAANLGYAPAQFYLAKLYENGEGGLRKDPAEARRWTERAAQGGDRKAMHNLGLYFFEGQGGSKNTTTAAQWFRKAADLGLSDSQYNLGRLYEEGYGVSQNAAEAYKWYLIAARAGDTEAKSSADRVRRDLSPEARSAAERSASGFRAAAPALPPTASVQASAVGAPNDITAAQRALSTLGYYRGPKDGVASQGLKGAIAAFQRDQGMAPTGSLDSQTMLKLSTYAR